MGSVKDRVIHELLGSVEGIFPIEIGHGSIQIGPQAWLTFPRIGTAGRGQIGGLRGIETAVFDETFGGIKLVAFDGLPVEIKGADEPWLRDPRLIGLGGGFTDLSNHQIESGVGE